jgi:hypothetical protein
MRPLLVLVVLLAALARADVFSASPGVLMASPLPASVKLRADLVALNYNISTSAVTVSLTTYFVMSSGPTGFVSASSTGTLMFSAPSLLEFALDNSTQSCTESSTNPVKLCPFLAEQLSGPWTFGAVPASGATTILVIEASTQRIDPSTNKYANFLGMIRPVAMNCMAPPCANLNAQVPQTQNSSFTVRSQTTAAVRTDLGARM